MPAQRGVNAADSLWSIARDRDIHFSCALGWGPGPVLQGFWRDMFSMARSGSRVLEIGCAGGQVALWAAEAGRGLNVVASDIVANPGGAHAHPDIAFVGNAPVEALPFETGAFDIVASNFVLEYAHRDRGLAEIARVLRPGGTAALVLHSADSVITQSSRMGLALHRSLEDAGVPGRVRSAAALPAGDPARTALLQTVLEARSAFPAAPPVGNTGLEYFDLARRLLNEEAGTDAVEALEKDIALRLDILRAQTRAALDAAGLARLETCAAETGFDAYTCEMTGTLENGAVQKVAWIAALTRQNLS